MGEFFEIEMGENVKLTLLEMAIHLNRAMPVKESIELMPGKSLVLIIPTLLLLQFEAQSFLRHLLLQVLLASV